MHKTKKLVFMALMVSVALVLSYIESHIPMPISIPGVKLGLANIITLTMIVFFSLKDVLFVAVLRSFLSAVFGGGMGAFLFSIAGGVLSAIVMYILFSKAKKFSIIGISIIGALVHNTSQIGVASILLRTVGIFSYFPIAAIASVVMGIGVGTCALCITQSSYLKDLFSAHTL